MMTIQSACKMTLPCGVSNIRSFTSNCCDFFFLEQNGSRVIKWRQCLDIEAIELERKYSFICYDKRENCFWALSELNSCLVYRLDLCFHEVGNIIVCGNCQQRAVSLNCDGQNICIAYWGYILLYDKCTQKIDCIKNEDDCIKNLCCVISNSCNSKLYFEGRKQFLGIKCSCNENMEICITKQYKCISMAPYVCEDICDAFRFYVLLCDICSNELLMAEYCVHFSEKCKDFYSFNPCKSSNCENSCQTADRCGAYEIMHSIALEEAGLAHILNAEGEKIQKAVAMSNNIEQLLCVNDSVKKTITQVTLLEGFLYSKLEALVSGDCEPPSPCPPSPCPPSPCCGNRIK